MAGMPGKMKIGTERLPRTSASLKIRADTKVGLDWLMENPPSPLLVTVHTPSEMWELAFRRDWRCAASVEML